MNRLMFLLLLISILSGCASITHDGRNQVLLVNSQPPGASIVYKEKTIGQTPAYVELRRASSVRLQINSAKESHEVVLTSHFDWRHSFLPNLIFFYAAPIGWTIDWITGSDRRLAEPSLVVFQNSDGFLAVKQHLLAIAPPTADNLFLSDASAAVWQQQWKNDSGLTVLPFKDTIKSFNFRHFEFDETPSLADRYRLYHDLGITEIFESETHEDDNGQVVLSGREVNVFTGDTEDQRELRISPDDLKNGQGLSWFQRTFNFLQFIPNTVGLELSNSDTQLTAGGSVHQAQPANSQSFLDQSLFYLGAVNINRQNPPRDQGSSRFRFQMMPSLFLLNRRISFPDFAPIASTQFRYIEVSGGFGAEIGWQKGPHYFYFNLIPMFAYEYLGWTQNNQNQELSLGAMEVRSETGYRYYWNRRWSSRVFSKTTSGGTTLWDSAVQQISPGAASVSGAINISAGIVVAYTFDFSPKIGLDGITPATK